jgi:hypothetical protein
MHAPYLPTGMLARPVVSRVRVLSEHAPCCPGRIAGDVDETFIDSACVALSFLRAHGGWLHTRFPALRLDPRQRYGRKWVVCGDLMELRTSGTSAGAALTGERLSYVWRFGGRCLATCDG